MADISLKQYLNRLETLLQDSSFDEAIYNSRHVLQHFPKNIVAYRVLGRALLEEGRWTQAAEVLRRVLSVEPDNFEAFVGLSQSYERLKRPDDAIWYMERAFEQRPNNEALTQKLRDLYAEYHNKQVEKINLTAGAVARQYKGNALYDQAIDVLQRTLKRYPNRGDLRILLTRVYREAERPIEAAEAAQDLLEQLPDCLEANVLLAKIWLAVERPSDAQRHISRIEPVAPYVAFEIAQGENPDENLFTLPELDYQRVAARELTSSNPDWLTAIEDPVADDDRSTQSADDVEATPATADEDFEFDNEDWLDDAESVAEADVADDDDWLSEVESMDKRINEAPTMPIPPPQTSSDSTGLTGLLSALEEEGDSTEGEDLDDLFDLDELEDEAIADELKVDGINLFDDDGDNAQLNDDIVDLFGDDDDDASNAEVLDLFGDDEPVDDDDPMAWLQDSGVDFIEDGEDIDTTVAPVTDSPLPASDAGDPLAWIKDSGIEIEIEEQADPLAEYVDEVDALQDPDDVDDPMAWLKSSGVEIISDDIDPAISTGELAELFGDDDTDTDSEADPLAWLKDSGIELEDEDDSAVASLFEDEQPIVDTGETPSSTDWLTNDDAVLDEMLDMEALASGDDDFGTGVFGDDAEQADAQAVDALPAVIADLDTPDGQDDMADTDNELPQDWFDSDSDDDWMSEDALSDDAPSEDTPADEQAEPVVNLFDDDASEGDEGDALDWMSDVEVESDAFTMDTSADEEVDLFGELPDAPQEGVVEPAMFGDTEAGLDWAVDEDDSATDDDGLGDLFGGEGDAEEDLDAVTDLDLGFDITDDVMDSAEAGDTPDWLSASAPESDDSADDDGLGDLFGDDDGDVEEDLDAVAEVDLDFDDADDVMDDAVVTDGVPDWLASVGEELDPEEDGVMAFSEEDALSDDEDFAWDEQNMDDEEPITASDDDMPDWLSASAPDAEDDDDDAFGFPQEDAQEDIVAFSVEDDSADDDITWDSEEDDVQEAVAEDMPDWLGAVGDAVDDADDDAFGFPEESDGEEDDVVITGDDMPEWLSASAPDAEDDDDDAFGFPQEDAQEDIVAFSAEDDSADDDITWDSEGDDAQEAVAEDMPDWLGAVGENVEDSDDDAFGFEDDAQEAEAEIIAFGAEDDGGDDDFAWDGEEEDAQEAVAEETPEWLSAIGADDASEDSDDDAFGFEDDAQEAEADIVAFGAEDDGGDDDFSWDGEEDAQEAVAEETPEWLSAIGADDAFGFEDDAQEAEADIVAFGAEDDGGDDDFSWDGEEDAQEAVAEETPEWLSAIGADDDSEDADDHEAMAEEDIVAFGAGHHEEFEVDAEAEDYAEADDYEDDDYAEEATPEWLTASAEDIPDPEVEESETFEPIENITGDWDDGAEAEPMGDTTPDWLTAAAASVEALDDDEAYDDEDIDYEDIALGPQVDPDFEEVSAEDMPEWVATASAAGDIDPDDYAEYDYDENIIAFGSEDTLLIDAEEQGESVPLAEAPPLDETDDVIHATPQAVDDSPVDFRGEAVPHGDDLPYIEDDEGYEVGESSLLYEEERAGIIDAPLPFDAFSVDDDEYVNYDDDFSERARLDYDTIEDDESVDAYAETEEITPTPADNAPDWLNTMVPGLDIDFEAPEDEPIETQFADDFSEHRRADATTGTIAPNQEADIEWLEDIVDEETSQPATLPEFNTEASAAEDDFEDEKPEKSARGRFTFSRLPAWLSGGGSASKTTEMTAESAPADEFDDELDFDDDIGEELPPWLDYDDDEF